MSGRHGRRLGSHFAANALLLGLLGPACVGAQVPFVPTPPDVVERMLTLARVGPSDFLIDLGCGDGRLVREAASKFGARGMGVDLDADLVARSTELARRDGVSDKVSFVVQDLFQTDISAASVLTMYLLPAVNLKLRARLLSELKPGTRVVSHDFDLADWQPDQTVKFYSKEKYGATGGDATVYLWIVPAEISGRWQWHLDVAGQSLDYELIASQRFQSVEGSVRVGGQQGKLEQVSLRGDALSFIVVTAIKGSLVRQAFSGRVAADAIEGTVAISGARMQGSAEWSAVRRQGSAAALGAQARPSMTAATFVPGRDSH